MGVGVMDRVYKLLQDAQLAALDNDASTCYRILDEALSLMEVTGDDVMAPPIPSAEQDKVPSPRL